MFREIEYGGMAARYEPRHIPDRIVKILQGFRYACKECGKDIPTEEDRAVRGSHVFHQNCASKYDARQTSAPSKPATSTRSIGFITGVCAEYGRRYSYKGIPEAVQPWSFSRALVGKRDIALRMDHNEARTIPCSLVFSEHGDSLSFMATIYDTPIGREAMGLIERGECRGTSLEFERPTSVHNDATISALVYDDVPLVAVSLCVGNSPAWEGTSVSCINR